MKKLPFSKHITRLVFWGGFFIIQECIVLIAYAIHKDFTATAAYLTAAIGVAEAMIMAVTNRYIVLAQAENTGSCNNQGEGITYASAMADQSKNNGTNESI